MKKIFTLVLSVALIIGVSGCSNNVKTEPIPVGTYEMNKSEEALKPSVLLEEDNKFTFNYSVLSSYIAVGSYEEDGDDLILKTDDNEFEYVFKIKGKTLIFNEKGSSEMPSFANVKDGSIFE